LKATTTVLAVISSAVIAWTASVFYHAAQTAIERVWMISAMKAPGRMAIQEIQADMKGGRYDLAKAKIDALADAWQKFEAGPDSPSGPGIGNIMVTFSKIDTNHLPRIPESGGSVRQP
jgi:hypothetical protein